MKKQTFGNMIVLLRKEKEMTQLELAEKLGGVQIKQYPNGSGTYLFRIFVQSETCGNI